MYYVRLVVTVIKKTKVKMIKLNFSLIYEEKTSLEEARDTLQLACSC